MFERITPPKIVPSALVSLGRSNTLMAGVRSDMSLYVYHSRKRQRAVIPIHLVIMTVRYGEKRLS